MPEFDRRQEDRHIAAVMLEVKILKEEMRDVKASLQGIEGEIVSRISAIDGKVCEANNLMATLKGFENGRSQILTGIAVIVGWLVGHFESIIFGWLKAK